MNTPKQASTKATCASANNAKRSTASDDQVSPPKKRNAELSKRKILEAALTEFADQGYFGARIDRIAEAAGVSKPLLYNYFGEKDVIYAAALREAYMQIRQGEKALNLDSLEPEEAVRRLVKFTMEHFRQNPWFISMLNTENLLGGHIIRQIQDAKEIQSQLLQKLEIILAKGHKSGEFKRAIQPSDLYILIASLCYFPISNSKTLSAVFNKDMNDDWIQNHTNHAVEMVIHFLKTTL